MKWKKSPPELIDKFTEAMLMLPDAEVRQMFGYPAAFANKNMFACLFEENMIIRLPEADRLVLQEQEGAGPFEPMPGHRMKEYVTVPPAMIDQPAELGEWLARSFAYAASLPPKKKKPHSRKS